MTLLSILDTKSYKQATRTKKTAILSRLALHREHWIRVRVAGNRHTSVSDLRKLANDHHPTVRANIACRRELPLTVILAIEARAQPLGDAGLLDMIQASLASRRDCPEAHLWRLFATQRLGVLIALAHNPSTPQALGEALAQSHKRRSTDEAKEVQEIAKKRWCTKDRPPE